MGQAMSKLITRTPILITGCQRSGTTLMNLILNSHPRIHSIDEDKFMFPSIYNYLSAPQSQAPPFVSFKLPGYAHMLPFIKMLPGCRVLWCVRNPLDTVWSMIKLHLPMGSNSIPWAVHPHGGWLEIMNSYWVLSDKQRGDLSGDMAEFAKLTEKLVKVWGTPDNMTAIERRTRVFMGALCWRIKNELPALYKAKKIDFHVIRYDDLVSNPKDRIMEILDYIGVEWSDAVLKHHRLHDGMSIGNTLNTRAIDQSSMGQGENNLSLEGQALIKTICDKTARRWNYRFN
jgi:Sulfotransferase domain